MIAYEVRPSRKRDRNVVAVERVGSYFVRRRRSASR